MLKIGDHVYRFKFEADKHGVILRKVQRLQIADVLGDEDSGVSYIAFDKDDAPYRRYETKYNSNYKMYRFKDNDFGVIKSNKPDTVILQDYDMKKALDLYKAKRLHMIRDLHNKIRYYENLIQSAEISRIKYYNFK